MSHSSPSFGFPFSPFSSCVRRERTAAPQPSSSRALTPWGRQTPCSENLPLCRRQTRRVVATRSATLGFEFPLRSLYDHSTPLFSNSSSLLEPFNPSTQNTYAQSLANSPCRKSLRAVTYGHSRKYMKSPDFKPCRIRSYARFFRKSFRMRSYVIKGGGATPSPQ
jgi:hypothetical protein